MRPGKIESDGYKWAQCGRCEDHDVIAPENPKRPGAYEKEARRLGWRKTVAKGWICPTCAQADAADAGGAGAGGAGCEVSSDRTYTLTVTAEQLGMISRACEVAARISIGQVDAIAFHLLASLPVDQYCEIQDVLETVQPMITGRPHLSCAPNDRMRDQHELAWSIYHAARHRLYLDLCADEGRTPDRMTVMSDPPRPCGRHDPPAIAQAADKETLTTGKESSPVELEAHWKAGFLRGAKWWYGRTESGTMWQSEQSECWQAAGRLWPAVRPERLEDARQIALAQAADGGAE